MILRRLTKIEKNEILDGYRKGATANDLASKFNCSSNTINRTVKSLISANEYKILKEKRTRINIKKDEKISVGISNEEQDQLGNFLTEIKDPILNQFTESEGDVIVNKINQENLNSFEEIPPLESNFDFDKNKINIVELDNEILPESVYMIVDKQVELNFQPISNIPEWSFLPEDELKRSAIVLFPNQRTAKRNCSKNQRVIKVPNTKVFLTTKSFLLSKGITRLIFDDSLISLCN